MERLLKWIVLGEIKIDDSARQFHRRLFPRAVLVAMTAILVLAGCNKPAEPDQRMIDLAVRATVHAIQTPTPKLIEVTRVVEVEVTRVVEVTRLIEVTATITPTSTPNPTSTPAPEANKISSASLAIVPPSDASDAQVQTPPEQASFSTCPAVSSHQFSVVPVEGPATDHPDYLHGDLNLALRGYVPADGELSLVTINGPTGADPPQLYHLFSDARTPQFTSIFRVNYWNWHCGEHGCRGEEIKQPSMIGMATTPGEGIYTPVRSAEIYGGDYRALVLYADEQRITLGYTREDTVAHGYAVHVEQICVDANLLARYRETNANGRGSLPALRHGEPIGTAIGDQILVAIRDRGAFMDPRSRKDWWQGR